MQKNHSNITFIIFTKNEEKRIEYPIKNFLPYGKVIISDDSTTDRTRKIAEKLGAKVIRRKTHVVLVENKKEVDHILKYIKTDWIFWGFADNMVPKTCLELYARISRENRYKLVVQKLKTLLYNNSMDFYAHINVTTRFFRKDAIDFSDSAFHQIGKFASHIKPSDILYLPPLDEYSVYHFSLNTTDSTMQNLSYYTTPQAQMASSKFLPLKIIFLPIYHFMFNYFIHGTFRHGVAGFFVAAQSAIYLLVLYSKVYEKQHNFTPETIEKNFIKLKKSLLHASPKSRPMQKIMAYIERAFVSRLHIFYKFTLQKKN